MRALLLLLLPLSAIAGPNTLAWSGQLLDPTGQPLSGDVALTVALFPSEAASPEDVLFQETFDALPVQGGYASVVLGAGDTPIGDAAFAADDLWVQVTVNDAALEPVQRLHGVPYAHTASRVGPAGSGVALADGGVVIEGDLRVDGATHLQSVQVGERYVLTIEGTACTNTEWTAVINNQTAHTLMNMRMAFSHCEDGCHHAYRHWTGFYNSYTTVIQLENTTSYGSNAGTWSFTRDRTVGTVSTQTTLRKSADPTHSYCGEVNVWIESNRPVSLVRQSS